MSVGFSKKVMIVNKSFITEVLRTVLVVTFVIICIFLVLRGMIFLSQAAEGIIPVGAVLSLVLFKMLSYLDVMIPLMFYIGLIMVLNRWYADHEMAVLASAGLGLAHFLKPLSFLVFVLGGLVTFFAFYLTPLSLAKGYALEQEYRQRSDVSGIITGRFVETKGGNGTYFVESYNRKSGSYENAFVYTSSLERESVGVARTARRIEDPKNQDQFLVLMNGSRYEGNPGSPDYRVVDFERYAIRLEPKNQKKLYLPIRARTNKELRESKDSKEIGEWYWRIGKIFTLPVLALFALALSHVDSRQGKATGMAMAFLVFLTYQQLLAYTVALIKKGEAFSGAPIWVVHFLYFMLACYCLYRRNYNLPMLPDFPRLSRKRSAA